MSNLLGSLTRLEPEYAPSFSQSRPIRSTGLSRSVRLQAKRFDQSRECGRLLSSTRVMKKVAGERRAPIFEHAHECAVGEVWGCMLLECKRQTHAIDRCANHDVRVIDDQWPIHGDGKGLVSFVELPP